MATTVETMQEDTHTLKPDRKRRRAEQKIWYSVAAGICILLALAGGWLLQQKDNDNLFFLQKWNTWENEVPS